MRFFQPVAVCCTSKCTSVFEVSSSLAPRTSRIGWLQWRNYGRQWRAAASWRQSGGGASRPVLKIFLPENNVNIVDLRALQLVSCVSFTHADQWWANRKSNRCLESQIGLLKDLNLDVKSRILKRISEPNLKSQSFKSQEKNLCKQIKIESEIEIPYI